MYRRPAEPSDRDLAAADALRRKLRDRTMETDLVTRARRAARRAEAERAVEIEVED